MPYDLTTMQSIYYGQDEIVEITYNNSPVYHKSSGPDYTEPFYLQDLSGSANTIQITHTVDAPELTIEQSTNRSTWTTLGTTGSTPLELEIPANGKVYLRCSTDIWSNSYNSKYNAFSTATGNFRAGGNIMSLLYGSNFDGTETTFPTNGQNTYCYLFKDNTNLIDISKLILPALSLTRGCYQRMFWGCTSLINTPIVDATTLYDYVFYYTFRDCTSLTSTAEIHAKTLAANCFEGMYYNCSSLNYVECTATSRGAGATSGWLHNVAATGTFVKAAGTTWPTGESGIPEGWTVEEYYYTEPFYVEDVSGNANTIQLSQDGDAPALTIETSTDKSTWSVLGTTSATPLEINVPANSKVYLRCSAGNWSNSFNDSYNYFSGATGNFKIGGNIMSLLYGSNFNGSETAFPTGGNDYKLTDLFRGNTHIVDASKLLLPATTMKWCCYYGMFKDCTSLTAAPALPATTLDRYCYSAMFENTAITTAPDLNAQNLPDNCYERMFNDCTALVTPPPVVGGTGSVRGGGCANMFSNCTSLASVPLLPSTSLSQDCYHNMFSNCTSLVQGPTLPATTLPTRGYENMFNGCTSLNHVTCLATSDIESNTNNWLNNVAATGTFVKAAGVSWSSGANGIPEGWTVIEQ